jgi:4-hydroxybenzoyl-CoA thioesterase
MAYTHRLTVRFDDVDYAQIVYFPKLFTYCHWAFEDFFAKEAGLSYSELLTKRKIGFPTVHTDADFKSPLRFGESCRIVMETVKLGTSALTNRFLLHHGESSKVCAEIELVHVAVNLPSIKPVKIPEDIRVAFLNHLHNYKSA